MALRDNDFDRLLTLRAEAPADFEALPHRVRLEVAAYEDAEQLRTSINAVNPAVTQHQAQRFQRDEHLEHLLRLRDEAPDQFAVMDPRIHDQVQVYADLRAPYTTALDLGLISND